MNTTTMTDHEALTWIADLFGLPVNGLTPDIPRTEVRTWDSLGVLMLMGGLDETFGIVVDDGDMRSMQKVGDILQLLRHHGKLG